MYGQTTKLAMGFQNSWGTANVSSLHWVPFLSESMKLDVPPLISQNMRGIFDEGEHYDGPKTVGGDVDVEAQAIPLGMVLASFFGNPTSTKVASTAVYNHVFLPQTSDWSSTCVKRPVTMMRQFETGSAQQFYNLNGATLEMNIANGEFMTAKVGFVGGGFNQLAPVSSSLPQGKKWTWNQTSVSLGGTARGDVVNLSVKLDDSIEAQHTLGDEYPTRIKRTGFRTISIEGTLKFDSQDEYQQFLARSERELDVTFLGNTAISSGYYDKLRIQVPLMRYVDFPPNAGGPGAIEVGFSGKGVYSVTSATAIKVTLTNTATTY